MDDYFIDNMVVKSVPYVLCTYLADFGESTSQLRARDQPIMLCCSAHKFHL